MHLQYTLIERYLHKWGIILSVFLCLCVGFGERWGEGGVSFPIIHAHTSG